MSHMKLNQELYDKLESLKLVLKMSNPKISSLALDKLIVDLYEKNNSFVESYENGNISPKEARDQKLLERYVKEARHVKDILEPFYVESLYNVNTFDREMED